MSNYSDLDYEILDFISKNDIVAKEKLIKKFTKISDLEYRLKLLSKSPAAIKEEFTSSGVGAYYKRNYLGKFTLTEHGKHCLLNHKQKLKKHNQELWLKNAWIPIIVSVITTLLVIGIQELLKWIL